MSAMREELHQLVDQLPEDEIRPALELIRGRVAQHGGQGRNLPFFASFEAEPDLCSWPQATSRTRLTGRA